MHGDPEPVSVSAAGDAVRRTRPLHAAWRIDRIARHLCTLRAGSLRHRQHRAALCQMGVFAALRRRGEGSARPRRRLHAQRSTRAGVHDAAARDAGRGMGRSANAGLQSRALWRSRRYRSCSRGCHRHAIDGGGKSDRADGLSRAQCRRGLGAGAPRACLRHPGRGVQLDRSQCFAGFAVLCGLRSVASAGTGRRRTAARYRRALCAAIRQARRSHRLDPDRHRSVEVGFPDVGVPDRHQGPGRLRDGSAAGARGGRRTRG